MATQATPVKRVPTEEKIDVVQIPRAAFTEALWSKPFSELRAMGERGELGLSCLTVPPVTRNLLGNGKCLYQLREVAKTGSDTLRLIYLDDDTCFVRGNRSDQTFLYAQNW